MLLKDLKTGDIVIKRNGEIGYIFDKMILYPSHHCDSFYEFHNDLTHHNHAFDIMLVYRNCSFFDIKPLKIKPIYERDHTFSPNQKINELSSSQNYFVKRNHTTSDLEILVHVIDTFEKFEKFLNQELMDEQLLLADYLAYLLSKYDVSANKAALAIGKSHSYVRKIINGKELNPSRDVLLALCIYLKTTFDECQTLLRYAGKAPLYARRKRDVIIWFAIRKNQSLDDLNIYLYDKGYPPLIKIIERK